MEQPFDVLPGVISTTSGYIGGQKENPTYKEVSSGSTGHRKRWKWCLTHRVKLAQNQIDVFWHNIDPTVADRQFCDGGSQYRPGIFYVNEAQKKPPWESKAAIEKSKVLKAPIVAEITEATAFYPPRTITKTTT